MAPTLDLETIEDLVDVGAFERGREYERQGRVQSYRWARADTVLEGHVSGSGGQAYRVNVMFSDADGQTVPTVGVCSCPVHVNCKHVVAVLLALRRDLEGGGGGDGRPLWEQLLSGLVPRDHRPAPAPLALQLELQPTADRSRLALHGRPLAMGSKGRWIRGRVSWSSVTYAHSYQEWNPDHHRILSAINALHATTRHQYGADPWLRLDLLPMRTLWSLLREAVEVGLTLLHTDDRTPVRLSDTTASLVLDLHRGDDELTVQPMTRLGEEPLDAGAFGFLGEPGQAIAYWSPTLVAVDNRLQDRRFSLALLDRPLPRELRGLTEHKGGISIPAADAGRFLDDFFPVLRSRMETVSTDRSFEPPSLPRPMLVLAAKVLPEHRLEVEWCWLYRRSEDPPGVGTRRGLHPVVVQGIGLLHPIGTHAPGGGPGAGRDAGAETALLERLDLGRFPFLFEQSPSGPRLAERVLVEGSDTVELVGRLLPELTGHPDVLVDIEGQQVSYRQATSAPTIELATTDIAGDRDWFGLAVTIRIEGEEVPFHEVFRALATGEDTMILPSGTYFSLDHPELRQLLALIEEANALSDAAEGEVRISRFQSALWDELATLAVVTAQAQAWQQSVAGLREGAELTEVPQPVGLQATLRDYQREGFWWLAFLYQHRLGGVLADDMGLGKTLQTLALICHVREQAGASARDRPPFLVVAPTSVVPNWAHECRRFAPGLRVAVISETTGRGRYTLADVAADADIVVTSYALFRIDFEAYDALGWDGLVLDEAQFVKNHQSRAYACVRRLSTPFKLAITGTPLENNLMELWSLFSITAPGLFGTPAQFGDVYRRPIEKDGDVELLARLRRRIRPLMLRRTKEQVASELPPKQEQVVELELLPRHRRVYQTHLQRERKKVLGLLDDLDENRFEIFRSLTALRQLSLDASLYDEKYADVPSTKLEALRELLEDIVAEGHRVLIFSQFTRFLSRVRDLLDSVGIGYAYLDGKTGNRAAVIDSFRTGAVPAFLISLKAGGFGLNLVEADYCILLDPWWNPAAEAQAIDRAHRIGQTRKVHVYRLVAIDTIEEKVMALKESKIKLFDSVMGEASATCSRLTAKDIRELLS
ncbi:DEAD/DEAH box helicase [Microlunatus panaciterrae]|uniref:Superfamily II DNA or RNA helicase n=1 Tax=Microlunatus panaciterrae TaxID=400768 RepID=A0ABS2RLY3_9ACTN|nr:DEAD/DEAH box helicase [Microlunatus panaciterrae]MBM7800020.1 superfamily II DNA or RNA helicase [Microlunatus panaciterrae]